MGALAFGIGTSEVEHVLATQTLQQKPAKNMLVRVDGKLAGRVHGKRYYSGDYWEDWNGRRHWACD